VTDWSLVQRSPTDCVASLCVIKKPRENEEAKACCRAVKIQPQWVVTPGKQTKRSTELYNNLCCMLRRNC
jgi:hypothetical protein